MAKSRFEETFFLIEQSRYEVSFQYCTDVFFVQSAQCRRSTGDVHMKLVVYGVINRYVLSARVVETNALLRFRFERPLNLAFVRPGREITVLECEFSRLTHTVNCRRVQEWGVMNTEHAKRPSIC